MSIRIPVGLCAVSALILLSAAFPAEARRRSVGKGTFVVTPPPPPPTGGCHTFGLVKNGTKATYRSTSSSGTANYTINYVSMTQTQTKTTQTVSTPQGNAEATTTVDDEIIGTLRATKHIDVQTVITVPVLGKLTTEVDIDFLPSLVTGPAAGWCAGNTWTVPTSNETIVTKAPFATPITTFAVAVGGTGEVLAVGESVTVPAGTFRTVKYRSVFLANNVVSPSVSWMSMDHNVLVKQDSYDASGTNIVTATQLTNLVSPSGLVQLPGLEAEQD
ncbi:MAG TPA: hypothetical protein VGQ76_17735 [Thermoanaerobaculia bacterium]|jgi:hypothetical protein|nr:hypothetical protein [Thermoanaerobaculia bacterium]